MVGLDRCLHSARESGRKWRMLEWARMPPQRQKSAVPVLRETRRVAGASACAYTESAGCYGHVVHVHVHVVRLPVKQKSGDQKTAQDRQTKTGGGSPNNRQGVQRAKETTTAQWVVGPTGPTVTEGWICGGQEGRGQGSGGRARRRTFRGRACRKGGYPSFRSSLWPPKR